jgi:hypothetical protein
LIVWPRPTIHSRSEVCLSGSGGMLVDSERQHY